MPTPEDTIAATGALDPQLAAMLGMLGGGGTGIESMAGLQSHLDTLAAQHPQLAPLMQMLQQRAAKPVAESDADVEPDSATTPPTRLADLQDLLLHAGRLEDEVETLRLRNDALAAALGACHLCFGEHSLCDACSGLGQPGWQRPEANAFRRFVTPAVRRVQADAASTGQRHPADSPAIPVPAPRESTLKGR